MRIVFDGTALRPRRTGVGYYAEHLLHRGAAGRLERVAPRCGVELRDREAAREEMERAVARRLQPYFVASFFLEAFKRLGGRCYEREPYRYEITHVPIAIRNRSMFRSSRTPILQRYERIVFEKERILVPGKSQATLICPGHPLLDATIDLLLEQHRDLPPQGTILVDPTDMGQAARVLFYLEHTIQDASTDVTGQRGLGCWRRKVP